MHNKEYRSISSNKSELQPIRIRNTSSSSQILDQCMTNSSNLFKTPDFKRSHNKFQASRASYDFMANHNFENTLAQQERNDFDSNRLPKMQLYNKVDSTIQKEPPQHYGFIFTPEKMKNNRLNFHVKKQKVQLSPLYDQ